MKKSIKFFKLKEESKKKWKRHNLKDLIQLCADDPEGCAEWAYDDDQDEIDAFMDQKPEDMALDLIDILKVEDLNELLYPEEEKELSEEDYFKPEYIKYVTKWYFDDVRKELQNIGKSKLLVDINTNLSDAEMEEVKKLYKQKPNAPRAYFDVLNKKNGIERNQYGSIINL